MHLIFAYFFLCILAGCCSFISSRIKRPINVLLMTIKDGMISVISVFVCDFDWNQPH